MDASLGSLFLSFSAKKLEQLSSRVVDSLNRLPEEAVWTRRGENDNAIGNLVLHLCGNVRQWIGAGIAGKPDIRVRDREFSARGGVERAELIERLEAVVADAVSVLRTLPEDRLRETVKVQAYELTILEAVYHVVEHFAQHAGQILFATKQLTGADLGYYRHLSQAAHSAKTP